MGNVTRILNELNDMTSLYMVFINLKKIMTGGKLCEEF